MLLRTLTATLHTEDWLDGEEKRNAKIVPHCHKNNMRKYLTVSLAFSGRESPRCPNPCMRVPTAAWRPRTRTGRGRSERKKSRMALEAVTSLGVLIIFFFVKNTSTLALRRGGDRGSSGRRACGRRPFLEKK